MQDNPWAQKYGLAPAAPQQAPQTPGIITGRPKQPSPIEQQRIAMEANDLAGAVEARLRAHGVQDAISVSSG